MLRRGLAFRAYNDVPCLVRRPKSCGYLLALCLGCGGQNPATGRPAPVVPVAPAERVALVEHFMTSAASAPVHAGEVEPGAESSDATTMNILPIHEWRQDATNWCWAATAQIVTDFADAGSGSGIKQCEHAEEAFKDKPNLDNCCSDPIPDGCKDGAFPLFEAFHYSGKRRVSAWLSWSAAQRELDQGRPFAVIESKTSSAHMVPIRGWAKVLGFRLVVLFDPNTGIHGWRLYDDYRKGEEFDPGFLYYQLTQSAPTESAKVEDEEPPVSEVTGTSEVGGGGPTSPTSSEALSTGLNLVRRIGTREPRLLGFASASDAANASVNPQEGMRLLFSTAGTINDAQPERMYFTLFLNDRPHGMIVVKKVDGQWYPVRFQADESSGKIRQARSLLAQLQLKEKSLIFVPELGRYLLQATTGMLLPVGPLGTLKKNRIYTPYQVRNAFKTGGVRIPH